MSYTPKEIKEELRDYKLPWITKIFKKYVNPVIKYSILPMFILLITFAIIYDNTPVGRFDWMWTFNKFFVLLFILGFGSFALTSHFVELKSTSKLRKKLGLTHSEFMAYVESHQITGM